MGKDVTRNIEEQLSAFIDGELPDEELQMLVRRLERDEEHRATLMRYALIGNVMRNDPVQSSANRFMAGVRTAIESDIEAAQGLPDGAAEIEPTEAPRSRLAPLAGAAAVMLAVVGLSTGGLLEGFSVPLTANSATELAARSTANDVAAPDDEMQVAVATEPTPAAVPRVTPVMQLMPPSAPRQAYSRRNVVNRERMTSYLVSHGDYARSLQGPMGDSRIFVQQASFER